MGGLRELSYQALWVIHLCAKWKLNNISKALSRNEQ